MSFKSAEKKIANEIATTLDGISEAQVDQLIIAIQQAERVFFVGGECCFHWKQSLNV